MKPFDEVKRDAVLETNWFTVQRSDIELPDGSVGRGWHWIDFPAPAVGVVPVRDDGAILLVKLFRFTTRTRDWEIPAGRVEAGELPELAAHRELREETGHWAHQLDSLGHFYPSNGSSNQEFILFVARGVEKVSAIQDTNEVDEARWFACDEVLGMLTRNEILDGMSVTGLLWYFFKHDE
jgi:ADP-ribose diphosphatase